MPYKSEINKWLKQTRTEIKQDFAAKIKELAVKYKKTR